MSLPDGWLTDAEADELRRLSADLTVLELGAWKGRSTVVLADQARYVVSVDRHEGITEAGGGDSLPDYLAAVRVLENVAIVVARFEEVVPLFDQFDMVYIDGDHDEESAARDLRLAHAVYPDVIVCHDWDFDSVRAAAATLGSPDAVVGSVASFRRKGAV